MQNQQPHNSLTLQLKRPPVFNVNRKRQHVANESKKRLQDANRKRQHVGNESKKRLQDANRKKPHVINGSRKRLQDANRKRPLPASRLMSNSRLISNSNNPTTNSRAIISSNPISSRLTSSLTTRLVHKALACLPFRHSHQHQEAVPTSP